MCTLRTNGFDLELRLARTENARSCSCRRRTTWLNILQTVSLTCDGRSNLTFYRYTSRIITHCIGFVENPLDPLSRFDIIPACDGLLGTETFLRLPHFPWNWRSFVKTRFCEIPWNPSFSMNFNAFGFVFEGFELFMVAVCNRTDHYIFALWFLLLSSSLFFFPRLISAAVDWMSTILRHMAWP